MLVRLSNAGTDALCCTAVCSLDDLVAGIWEVQEHIDGLTDVEDDPKGLQRGLAGLSAVAEQRSKLQVFLAYLLHRAAAFSKL